MAALKKQASSREGGSQVGSEMKDEHHCVVITPREINAIGMCLIVPITTGGMFVRKAGLAVNKSSQRTTGVPLCKQVRGLDIAARVVSMIDPG